MMQQGYVPTAPYAAPNQFAFNQSASFPTNLAANATAFVPKSRKASEMSSTSQPF
jgi:hypothetical protein